MEYIENDFVKVYEAVSLRNSASFSSLQAYIEAHPTARSRFFDKIIMVMQFKVKHRMLLIRFLYRMRLQCFLGIEGSVYFVYYMK